MHSAAWACSEIMLRVDVGVDEIVVWCVVMASKRMTFAVCSNRDVMCAASVGANDVSSGCTDNVDQIVVCGAGVKKTLFAVCSNSDVVCADSVGAKRRVQWLYRQCRSIVVRRAGVKESTVCCVFEW
jgi:hypothetical protein